MLRTVNSKTQRIKIRAVDNGSLETSNDIHFWISFMCACSSVSYRQAAIIMRLMIFYIHHQPAYYRQPLLKRILAQDLQVSPHSFAHHLCLARSLSFKDESKEVWMSDNLVMWMVMVVSPSFLCVVYLEKQFEHCPRTNRKETRFISFHTGFYISIT